MSDTTEQDLLSKHRQSLSEAGAACQWLGRNADPELASPRGGRYSQLRTALQELEGTCRQLAHWREDTRWLKLGMVYARAMKIAQVKMVGQNWMAFRELASLFEHGVRRMDDLANAKTERCGVILPKRTDFLIMPDIRPATRFNTFQRH